MPVALSWDEEGYVKHVGQGRQDFILGVLISKYEADPEGFRSYLPEVADELEQLLRRRRKDGHASALTEPERERLHEGLIELLGKKELGREEAVRAIEYCGTLIQDGSLPSQASRETLLRLVHQVVGVTLSKVKRATSVPVGEGEAVKEVPLLYGVHLHLTWNDHLVTISVSPSKVKERSKALRFVGIAKDAASDVAQRHDAYLAEAVLNAIR